MQISLRKMLEAGAHFGHQTKYWHPAMSNYIFGHRNKIHIINLEKTLEKFQEALNYIGRLTKNGGTILFVGTKRQCREIIKDEATKCSSPFVDHRWLGGMLTNFDTVTKSIKKLKDMDADIESGAVDKMIKKTALDFTRDHQKLTLSFGGIKELDNVPDCLFIVDIGFHKIAVKEAVKLGIPIVAIVDTNHDPSDIDYIIPANDDSSSSVKFFTEIISAKIAESKKIKIESIVEDSDDFDKDSDLNQTD